MVINKIEDEKRKDIIKTHNKNMLVEAGAGAGKTRLVVTRNVEQLKSGALTARELVDITFTNAAAEELRRRLLDALHEVVGSLAGEERQRIEEAIKDESLIQISTIHSFCKRLLTEKSFAARLPMDVELLDDVEATKLKNDFFTKWYRKQNSSDISLIEDEFYRGDAGKFIFDTFMQICELPDDTVFHYYSSMLGPGQKKLNDYQSDIMKQLYGWWTAITDIAAALLPDMNYYSIDDVVSIKDHSKTPRSIIKVPYINLKEAFDAFYVTRSKQDWKKLYELYISAQNGPFAEDGNLKDPFQSITEFKFKKDEANPSFMSSVDGSRISDTFELYQNALIVQKALEARDAYRAYCLRPENRNKITNDALLQEALRIVKNDDDAREHFQRSFSCIYVDEFQDTDLVQKELVEILCQDPENPDKLREGSLFFVGDPKQSIYAFRGADVDVYSGVKEKYSDSSETNVEVYVLDNNYRSEKAVIDWVNKNFENKFNDRIKYSKMNAIADNSDDPMIIRGVYTLKEPVQFNSEERKKLKISESKYYNRNIKKKKKLEMDSKLVVSIIRHLVDEHFQIWDKQKEKTDDGIEQVIWKKRDIRYSDFLLLSYKKEYLNLYADKLKKIGIPTNLCGAVDNENEGILLRAIQLFKALTYPYDRAAVHGAKEVLVSGRITKKNEEKASARFELLQSITKYKNGSELLQFIAHHPEYLMKEKYTGEEALRAQSRLQQMLEAVQIQQVSDRQETYKQLMNYLTTGSDKELSLEKDANAVRLMNLHKAKGLEGKIVIICARGQRKYITKKAPFRQLKEYYPSAISRNISDTFIAPYSSTDVIADPYDATVVNCVADLVIAKEENERFRQEYVEATRAEEALIFMDSFDPNSRFNNGYDFSDTKKIMDISQNLQKNVEEIYAEIYTDSSVTRPIVTYDVTAWDPSVDDNQKERQSRSITPSGMEHGNVSKKEETVEVTDDVDVADASESEETTKEKAWNPGPEPGRPYSGVFGDVLHRSMELLVKKLRRKESYEIIHIIHQAMMENYTKIVSSHDESESEARIKLYEDYLTDRLNSFLADQSIMDEIVTAKDVFTEVPFSMYTDQEQIVGMNEKLRETMQNRFPSDGKLPYWVNGKADLVIVTPDNKVHIVDYKSDHIGSESMERFHEHLSNTYDNQQELYRFTLSKMLDIPIEDISYRYYHMYMERETQ